MKKTKLGFILLCGILLVACGGNSDSSSSSNQESTSSIQDSTSSSTKTSSSTTKQSSSSSSRHSTPKTTISPSLPSIDEATAEKLQACFEEANLIPEVLVNHIKLPTSFTGIPNTITWTITRGNEYIALENNVLKIKDNETDISSVCEVVATVSGVDFTYTYHCISHTENNHDLPIFDIHTVDNVFPEDKENYITGDISVIDYNNEEYSIDIVNATMGIRLRGNSTMPANKKPFRIKFDKKQSLFGLTAAKSWVLLANYYDKSNIRNYLAYTMANKMDYLDFQPSAIFVEVRFNGDFLGLYLLSEQMQSGEGRVDIEDDIDTETGMPSYFIELNSRADDEEEGLIRDVEYFVDQEQRVFEYKYPEPNDDNTLGEGVNDYIVNYMNQTDDAIFSLNPDEYEKYIDVNSFIDYYIVEELFKNVDVADTSQYYVKYANGKLKMGPVWDFDISLGVIDYPEYWNTELHVRMRDFWFGTLLSVPKFLDQTMERYTEIRNTIIEGVLDDFVDIIDRLDKAQKANLERWPLEYNTNQGLFIEEHYYDQYESFTTLEAHYGYLESQLRIQIGRMDKNYLIK